MEREMEIRRDIKKVKDRSGELGLEPPSRFAVLPDGFDAAESKEDLVMSDESITVRKLLRQEGLDETALDDDLDLDEYRAKSAEVIGPTLYFTFEFVIENWELVVTAIGIIKGYYKKRRVNSISFSLRTEDRDGRPIEFEYEGPPEDMDTVLDKAKDTIDIDTTEKEETQERETERESK